MQWGTELMKVGYQAKTRPCLAAMLLGAILPAGGCDFVGKMLDFDGKYLFVGHDAVALPGEDVAIRARLQKGNFLRDVRGAEVRFFRDGRLVQAVKTSDEGFAAIRFVPREVGDYRFVAEYMPHGGTRQGAQAEVLLACRGPDTHLFVVDLDRTLVNGGFKAVLAGQPPPMPHSDEVVNRLAGEYTIVYLTRRLDYLGRKSKEWLKLHGYPPGTMFLSEVRRFLDSNEEYKSSTLADIRRRFRGKGFGIGDQVSDVKAYLENALTAIMILHVRKSARPHEIRKQARELDALPASVQVVRDWEQVEKIVFHGESFPPSRARQWLEALADEIERKKVE